MLAGIPATAPQSCRPGFLPSTACGDATHSCSCRKTNVSLANRDQPGNRATCPDTWTIKWLRRETAQQFRIVAHRIGASMQRDAVAVEHVVIVSHAECKVQMLLDDDHRDPFRNLAPPS